MKDSQWFRSADYQTLIRAVCADPADDLPRLALADWCEENGHQRRADMIREQIEAARVPDGDPEKSAAVIRAHSLSGDWQTSINGVDLKLWRGFACRATLSSHCYSADAPTLFSDQPITEVRFRDKYPFHAGHVYRWYGSVEDTPDPTRGGAHRHVLPAALWEYGGDVLGREGGFSTAGEANAALSDMAVSMGRMLAGLPPLAEPKGGEK